MAVNAKLSLSLMIMVSMIFVFCAGCVSMSDPIVGTWHMKEGGMGTIDLEFYDNGQGTAHAYVDKGVESASDYGLNGYVKKIVFDFAYQKVGNLTYSATILGAHVESYTGQSTYISGNQLPDTSFGMFEIHFGARLKKTLEWTWHGETDILTR
ncbi:hypothetical protein [Methanorbis furvi]|uniref:Uncharacterized protein n=1 Tax=Methanorbis furvi TaxID=3028299 RepID=A0AAE4MBW0_9EURY|nr:hypothetical protein [Methanocorpusculaceae archaeon Ag1]